MTPTEGDYADRRTSTKVSEAGVCCIAIVRILGKSCRAVDAPNQANRRAVQYVHCGDSLNLTMRVASKLIVFMHYVRILIALPCLRVTFCCIILGKAVIRVQIRSCILLSLMYSWCCRRYVLHTHHTPFARYTNTHMFGEHQVAKHQLPLLLPAPLPPLSPALPSLLCPLPSPPLPSLT